jgi:hypothetical protein
MYNRFNKYLFPYLRNLSCVSKNREYIPVAHFLAPINRTTEHSPFRRIVGMSVAYQKHHSALQLHICPLNKSKGGNISADALLSPMTAAM